MSDDLKTTTTRHETREDKKRKLEWKDPNELDIPDSLKERLRSQGYGTRWIRVMIQGQPDPKNVMLRTREGYEFVTKQEAPEWPDAPTYEYGTHGSLIIIGDLALAKLPLEITKDRNRKMAQKTRDLTDAIARQLQENQVLNRLLPIQNSSKSQVFRGRKADLDSDD
jgi:hypothetical protein